MKASANRSLRLALGTLPLLGCLAIIALSYLERRRLLQQDDLARDSTEQVTVRIDSLEKTAQQLEDVDLDASLIPSVPDVAAVLHTLEVLGEEAAVQLDDIQAPSSVDPGRQTYLVVGHGGPEQVCTFIAQLEQDSRLLWVEQLSLQAAADGSIDFQLRVAGFHRLEETGR